MDRSSAEHAPQWLTIKLLQLLSPLTRRDGDGPAGSARWDEVMLGAADSSLRI